MNIVANNYILRFFKKISIFKLDLGTNLKGPAGMKNDGTTFRIRDEFVKKYQTLNLGNIIRKYGEIGTLKFYEDGNLPLTEFHIYKDDKIYEMQAVQEDLLKDPGAYLTEILQLLDDGALKEEEDNGMIKNVSYSNMPENLERPNMKLPRDQYVEALLNRRRLLEKI